MFDLLEVVPHDSKAYTQGLEILSNEKIAVMKNQLGMPHLRQEIFHSSYVLESIGKYGKSALRIVELASGNVVQELELDETYYGQGCTYYYAPPMNDTSNGAIRIVQITWKEGRGFVYELTNSHSYMNSTTTAQQGWSLSRIGDFEFNKDHLWRKKALGIVYHPLRNQFIVSDGSSTLHVWELTERRTIPFIETGAISTFEFQRVDKFKVYENRNGPMVTSNWTQVRKLNELEWDPYSYGGNTILANILPSKEIARIWVGSSRGKEEQEIDNDKLIIDESSRNDLGKISHVYNLTELDELANPSKRGSVLNGIAFVYDSSAREDSEQESISSYANQFWVTGRFWPSMYRVKLIDG